jgi:hypothetical protein
MSTAPRCAHWRGDIGKLKNGVGLGDVTIHDRLEPLAPTSRRATIAHCLTAPLMWGYTKGFMSA